LLQQRIGVAAVCVSSPHLRQRETGRVGNKTNNRNYLLCAGEPNTVTAIAHSWLGPIQSSSSSHKLCVRPVRSADIPPPALASIPSPGQYSLDLSWLVAFNAALTTG